MALLVANEMRDADRYVLIRESADRVPVGVRPVSDLAEARLHLKSLPEVDRHWWYILDVLENKRLEIDVD